MAVHLGNATAPLAPGQLGLPDDPMAQSGTVKWFNEKLGYGFIECSGSDDVFVHFSVLRDTDHAESLSAGEQVEFETRDGDQGPIAEWVARPSV